MNSQSSKIAFKKWEKKLLMITTAYLVARNIYCPACSKKLEHVFVRGAKGSSKGFSVASLRKHGGKNYYCRQKTEKTTSKMKQLNEVFAVCIRGFFLLLAHLFFEMALFISEPFFFLVGKIF